MATRTCPYCNMTYMQDSRLDKAHQISFCETTVGSLEILQHRCPNCQKISVTLFSTGSCWGDHFYFSYPPANAMYLPDYIPAALRQDYREAMQIINLSPKAAATLARRCLQGMIHDFWGIREKNLNAEITSLKNCIPAKQWNAIDAIRKIGNIGAHMEKDVELMIDVDQDEAEKLLRVVEYLFKSWYISKHEEDLLYEQVSSIAESKDAARSVIRTNDGE